MAVDLRRLKPAQLCELVNGTPLGPVLEQTALNGQRRRAGAKIGDGRTIHFLRYLAWLVLERHSAEVAGSGGARSSDGDGYEKIKEAARDRQARLSRQGRDIGPIPAVKQPARRAACEHNLELFLLTFFPHLFYLPFSEDHRKVIRAIQKAVLEGGLFAYAMPRGSGKTTIAECAAIWASLYGHRGYVVILGSTAAAAEECLDSIKTEFETNELLADDFPEVCYPIQQLEGIVNRCKGQLCQGRGTHMRWRARQIVLPTIAGSKTSGAILQVAGLTGRIRGIKLKRRDGTTARPDFVLPDDPQTRDSAESLGQCDKRERTLAGDVLGMAGPGKKISGLMPCTVIQQGDLADRMLDRKKHPEWNGVRLKALYAFPTDQKLWDCYGELWAQGLRDGEGLAPCTKFYADNRAAMDLGGVVAWPERFNPDELSGLQNLINLKLQDEAAFLAEYQNDPKPLIEVDLEALTADDVARKFNMLPRGIVPLAATRLVAFIDVHGTLLYYTVLAVANDFTGWVIDYGAFPEQARHYFTLREAQPTLKDVLKRKAGLEGMIYAGLDSLTSRLCGRDWKRAGGALVRIERCLIDANWGKSTDTVYTFCRQSPHAAILLPSHGKFFGPTVAPLSSYEDRPGEMAGLNWRITAGQKRAARHVIFDANQWKSFTHARLGVAMGDKSCLSLFGANADQHRMFADHQVAERRTEVSAKNGRTVDQWDQLPNRENHWFDCLVGCHVAASIQGAKLFVTPAKQTVKLSEIKRTRRVRDPQERE